MNKLSEFQRKTFACLLIFSFVGWTHASAFPGFAAEQDPVTRSTTADGAGQDVHGGNSGALEAEPDVSGTTVLEQSAGSTPRVKKKHFPWLGAILSVALAGVLVYYLIILKTSLHVDTDPAGARIYLDGKDSGQVSPCQLKLSAGSHKIKAVLEGYADVELEVVVKNGQNKLLIPLDIGTFALTTPAANDNVQRETACLISWDSTAMPSSAWLPATRKTAAVTRVDLELFQPEGKVSDIVRGVPNSGTFQWNVPASTREGHNFKVKISCSDAPATHGFGPGFNLLGFKEDFTDERADFWLTDAAQSWTAAGGLYSAANAGSGYSLAIYDFFYGESAYSIESRMRWRESGGGPGKEPIFIMLGTSNSFSNNSGYLFGYDTEGRVSVFRVENFDFRSAQSGSLSPIFSGLSGAVIPGLLNWNTVNVVRSGSNYSLRINGTLVHSLVDGTFIPTHVMIGFGASGARTVGEFDHVHMTVVAENH